MSDYFVKIHIDAIIYTCPNVIVWLFVNIDSQLTGTWRHIAGTYISYDNFRQTSTHPQCSEGLGMMMSSNGNIFPVLALCAGNSPVTGDFLKQRPVTCSFDGFFISTGINAWVNNREAGDLRCHRAHYDVIIMMNFLCTWWSFIGSPRIVQVWYAWGSESR